MKTKFKFLFGILTVIACILFGCEKREAVSLEELSLAEEELNSDQVGQETEAGTGEPGNTNEEKTALPEENTQQPHDEVTLVIHICGAVNNPGVYVLPEGSRIYQAVLAAGGFGEEADRDFLNQAQVIGDGSKIYVPTKEEAALAEEGSQEFISGSVDGLTENDSMTDSGLVNINTASREELCNLAGIGVGKAESIINYRRENGNFHTIEEIMNVEGIKDGLFQKIKDKITV